MGILKTVSSVAASALHEVPPPSSMWAAWKHAILYLKKMNKNCLVCSPPLLFYWYSEFSFPLLSYFWLVGFIHCNLLTNSLSLHLVPSQRTKTRLLWLFLSFNELLRLWEESLYLSLERHWGKKTWMVVKCMWVWVHMCELGAGAGVLKWRDKMWRKRDEHSRRYWGL